MNIQPGRLRGTSGASQANIPGLKSPPVLKGIALQAVGTVVAAVPRLRFPLNSAAELMEQLGGRGTTVNIAGRILSVETVLGQVPSHYFPIASMDNFVEKIAGLIRRARNQRLRLKRAFASVKRQIHEKGPGLHFPITSAEHLKKSLGPISRVVVANRSIVPSLAVSRIPQSYYPITSKADFNRKIWKLMQQNFA